MERVYDPVERFDDLVEIIHNPVEGVHNKVAGVDAVDGVVDAFAVPLLLPLSFLSALAFVLISSRCASSRKE